MLYAPPAAASAHRPDVIVMLLLLRPVQFQVPRDQPG